MKAGIYDVRLVRDECNDYQKFDAVFTSVFEISKSSRTISGWTPTVKDVYKVNLLATELPRDIYKGDGRVEYAISTSGSIPTEGWQESRSFMNLKSGSNYYVFVRVTEGENYLAAPAIGSNVATAITGSITGNTKWEPRIQIKTFDGTDRAIHGTYGFYDGNWSSRTKLTGNGNDFEKGDDDYYTIKGWGNYDPWMISKYRLEFDHLVGQGWGCENLKPLVEYNDQRIRASQIDVNKKFNSDQNIIYDVTGFQRVIEEVGNFSSTGEDGILTNINLNNENLAEVYTFTYNGKVRDQYALPVVIIDGENSYIEYAYDAYDHYDAPSMYIEADKDKYNQYLDYTINSISINLANLKEVMENDGVTSTNIEVTLKFPERSATNETSKWTKIITVSFE